VGAALQEITETVGRAILPTSLNLLNLFRYAAPGQFGNGLQQDSDTIPRQQSGKARIAYATVGNMRPDRRERDRRSGLAITHVCRARDGQLTNAVACRRFGACRYTTAKESPGRAGAR
jgi:hypothetical protein